jgi:hypothetical protein
VGGRGRVGGWGALVGELPTHHNRVGKARPRTTEERARGEAAAGQPPLPPTVVPLRGSHGSHRRKTFSPAAVAPTFAAGHPPAPTSEDAPGRHHIALNYTMLFKQRGEIPGSP